ncbi:MAG: hypothetical protein CUN52_11640 [Phototrophicales bacterium]|nr:MAG: hypothetical protein CUN52_11640 [Phototrophicales bacterium]
MSHQTKDKGDLAVLMAIADLRKHGIIACLPISEHLPFDMIAIMPDMTTLVRLQVKYRKTNGVGTISIPFRSNYYDSKKIYSKHVDLSHLDGYAVYSPETNQMYYIRIDELLKDAKAITLRLNPPKNYQKTRIWYAENFINPSRLGNDNFVANFDKNICQSDEKAVDFVMLDLIKQNIQPLIPRSTHLPFHLVGVCEDMKTRHRYCIGMDEVATNPYVDIYAICSSETGGIQYILANTVTQAVKKLVFVKEWG